MRIQHAISMTTGIAGDDCFNIAEIFIRYMISGIDVTANRLLSNFGLVNAKTDSHFGCWLRSVVSSDCHVRPKLKLLPFLQRDVVEMAKHRCQLISLRSVLKVHCTLSCFNFLNRDDVTRVCALFGSWKFNQKCKRCTILWCRVMSTRSQNTNRKLCSVALS